MAKLITSKNIIGDIHFLNFIEQNCPNEILLAQADETNEYSIFQKIILNNVDYYLFNCGINCFMNSPFSETDKWIVEKQEELPQFLERYRSKFNPNGSMHEMLNFLFSFKDNFNTIKIKSRNGSYYTVDSEDYDYRLITTDAFKEKYIRMPEFILRPESGGYELVKPAVVIPGALSLFSPTIFNKLIRLNMDKTTKNISFELIKIIVEYGESMKIPLFDNLDLVYIQKDKMIFEVIDQEKEEIYIEICKKFYENEYNDYLSFAYTIKMNNYAETHKCKMKCTCCSSSKMIPKNNPVIFKEKNNFFKKGNPEFYRIENDLRKFNSIMSFCETYNFVLKDKYDFLIVEVTSYNKKEEVVSKITEEEALKNAEELLAMEEMEKKKSSKKSKCSQKRKEKKILEKIKKIAKNISIEVLKLPARINKQKIAHTLAKEAQIYLENKSKNNLPDFFPPPTPELICEIESYLSDIEETSSIDEKLIESSIEKILDENSEDEYCELGDSEYERRRKEWDLDKIIPNIYCFPKSYLISFFTKKMQFNYYNIL